jgi:hypothetical protein
VEAVGIKEHDREDDQQGGIEDGIFADPGF